MKEIKVILLGFGGIARAHASAYFQLMREGFPVRLVAICDHHAEVFHKQIRINLKGEKQSLPENIHLYTDIDEMLAAEDFDMADICLPTYLHCPMTLKLLNMGKHVLVEKPMALSYADCKTMLKAAADADRRLMVGQCLRFEPAYVFLKECVCDGRFGSMKNLYMTRLSKFPDWADFYASTEQSGGCILDLHVHDVDMARYLLGDPQSVSSIAYDETVRWQHVNTRMFYRDLAVIATGSFTEPNTAPFVHGYRARFERASVVFDRETVNVYPDDGEVEEIRLTPKNRITEEIRYFSRVIAGEIENEINPPTGAAEAIRLVELMRKSVALGGERIDVSSTKEN